MHRLIACIPIICLLLNGCKMSSIDGPASPEVPDAWSAPANAKAVEVGWIETFSDKTLSALVKEAQENNKNLQAAAASVERARGLAVKAGAALQPYVSLSAGASGTGPGSSTADMSTTKEMNLALQVQWEVDVWGRIRAGVGAAEASAQASEADYRYAQHSVAANTAIAYFAAIAARQQIEAARSTVDSLDDVLRITKAKKENGIGTSQDVALAKSDLAAARERLVAAEGSKRDAVRALELLLGRYPEAELGVRTSLPELPPNPPAGIPAEILERRPDLVAKERRVAAAFNAVQQAKAARLPRLSLTSGVGGTSSELSDILDPAKIAWQAAANLLQPLFDGGALKADEWIANAEQKQAVADYANAALNAFAEVEGLLDNGETLHKRVTLLGEAQREAEEAYRVVQLRHKEGESELLEVLTVRQRVDSTRSNSIGGRRALLEQRVKLHLALGGSWQ